MRIDHLETFTANAGMRNYLFVRLTTDSGLTGVGEATLEWQEKAVESILHDWVAKRIAGEDPFDIERVVGSLIRDQYQGGPAVMTAISGVEMAMWDLVGKSCGQPVHKLIGGRCHAKLPAYANGWYGSARTSGEWAECAREVISRGYRGMKFDPFGIAWKELSEEEQEAVVEIVAAVRDAVGPCVELMLEYHGRFSARTAIEMTRKLERFRPAWIEEPVAPENLELMAKVRSQALSPIAAGERLYTIADFARLFSLNAVDIVQMDIAHCGGILTAKKIATLAAVHDIRVSPHCSIGPVALAAALHFDASTPNFTVQETFSDYDVPWRKDLVGGWNPVHNGEFILSNAPGLGIEMDLDAIAAHPYQASRQPNLWDDTWLTNFSHGLPAG